MSIARSLAAVAAGCAFAALAPVASAQTVQFNFPLSGLQEVPANASPATGEASLLLNIATGAFTLDYSYSGLTGTVTMAHFHQAPAGTNGGVVYWLASMGAPNNLATTLMDPSMPIGLSADSGSGSGIFSPDLIGHAIAGNLYMNVHTTTFGGGEIRGQVVPTPGAAALLGLGSLVAVARRRRHT